MLVAVGGADNAVRLYLREAAGTCTALCKLQGHTDWVTSLAFSAFGAPKQSNEHVRAVCLGVRAGSRLAGTASLSCLHSAKQ